MRVYDIIKAKRDGSKLSKEEIDFLIKGYTLGDIPDYQMSALTMAIFFSGMDDEETALLTHSMATSGDVLDLSMLGDRTVDKHSTGGVGDKTTLAVAPIAASAGAVIAKMSGRGLGHTGGTIDKLESIPGFRTFLPNYEFISQVRKIGISVVGQTGDFAPADKKLYALRDVTATVDSLPLIASSIMSKKIAAGSHNIVLDVKCGSGAFMKTLDDATALAEKMVDIGLACNRKVSAFITDMNRPLGDAVGNSLEVIEAIETLRGNGPDDFTELATEVSAKMISMSLKKDLSESRIIASEAIKSGKAYEKMLAWISAQGGDTRYIENTSLFNTAPVIYEIKAPCDGYIASMDSEKIGLASLVLGAGREKMSDIIDHSSGIRILYKTASKIRKNDTIALLYTSDKDRASAAEKIYLDSLKISDQKVEASPLIYKTVN